MVGVRLEFTDNGTVRYLTHLRDRLDDPEPVWKEYTEWLYKEFERQFETEGLYLGHNPWAPLSAAYKARKEKKYPGAKILQATKRLYHSLTRHGDDNEVHYSKDSYQFGSKVPYLKYHQTGTSRMPARPPIANENELAAGLGRIWMRHLLEGSPSESSSKASEI